LEEGHPSGAKQVAGKLIKLGEVSEKASLRG
jgi:hypothetical protein